MNTNLVWHEHKISQSDRQKLLNQKPMLLWFTGLSGSGKSTIAGELEYQLFKKGLKTYLLDGDNVRHGLNKDLGFSNEDRKENIRRIAEVSKLFVDSGTLVMTAFISPFIEERELARSLLNSEEFVEIYIRCPLSICEERDPKGMYKKARSGEIKKFTGIDSPYEEPPKAELVIDSDKLSVEDAVGEIIKYLSDQKGIFL